MTDFHPIRIGPFTYEVEESPDLHDGADRLYGEVDHEGLVITLHGGSALARKRVSMLHEIIHAIANAHGVTIEEQAVVVLAGELLQVLTDNLWLPGWLLREGIHVERA